MSIWHDVDPSRITPTDFLAVIEISKGCKNKYELDKETGKVSQEAYCTEQIKLQTVPIGATVVELPFGISQEAKDSANTAQRTKASIFFIFCFLHEKN